MSVDCQQDDSGLLTMKIRGKLNSSELAAAQRAAAAALRQKSGLCILVQCEAFEGFAQGGDWGDLSFQINDVLIEKMAIVADQKWKDSVLMFVGKGFRKFPIEFFAPDQIDRAREWLGSPTVQS